MSYKVFSFTADQNMELCMDYCQNYMRVLSEYGTGRFTASKQTWMEQKGVHAVVMYNERDEMIGGIRLHLSKNGTELPVETRVMGIETAMETIRNNAGTVIAEICGMWVGKDYRNEGLEQELCQAATVLAYRCGATSLLVHSDPQHYDMFTGLGYIKVDGVGRNADFMSPSVDYSMLMILPNLETLKYANDIQKAAMLSLREKPVHTFVTTEGNFLYTNYELSELIENIAVHESMAVLS